MKRFIILCLFVALNFSASADVFIKNKNLVQKIDSVVSAAGTTALIKTSNYWQELTGATTQTYTLPDATTMSTGRSFGFKNNSSGTATINDNVSGLVKTLLGGDAVIILLTDNSGAAGTWTVMEPESTPLASHAANHIDGGSDVVDGDKLEITRTPTSYTPDTSPPEVNATDQLTAHLKGIENALDAKAPSDGAGIVEDICGHIEVPEDKTYFLKQSAPYPFTVNSITAICDSGTISAQLENNASVALSGCATADNPWSNVQDSSTCTSNNTFIVGDNLALVLSSNSASDDCRFCVKVTRD